MSILRGSFGAIRLVRPRALIWFDLLPALTFASIILKDWPETGFIIVILSLMGADAGSSAFNDLADIKSDRLSLESSRKNRPLVKGDLTPKTVIILGGIFISLSLVLAFMYSPIVLLFITICVVLGLQYSLSPLHFNSHPIRSRIFWPILWTSYFLVIVAALDVKLIYNGIPYLIFVILFTGFGETLAKDLRDFHNDKKGGKKTSVVRWGVSSQALLSIVTGVIGTVVWLIWIYLNGNTISGLFILAALFTIWNIYAILLCKKLLKEYEAISARRLHNGYIITFSTANIVTMVIINAFS